MKTTYKIKSSLLILITIVCFSSIKGQKGIEKRIDKIGLNLLYESVLDRDLESEILNETENGNIYIAGHGFEIGTYVDLRRKKNTRNEISLGLNFMFKEYETYFGRNVLITINGDADINYFDEMHKRLKISIPIEYRLYPVKKAHLYFLFGIGIDYNFYQNLEYEYLYSRIYDETIEEYVFIYKEEINFSRNSPPSRMGIITDLGIGYSFKNMQVEILCLRFDINEKPAIGIRVRRTVKKYAN